MNARLKRLDYCPRCDLPMFDHEMVAVVGGRGVYHLHCFRDAKMVAKWSELMETKAN